MFNLNYKDMKKALFPLFAAFLLIAVSCKDDSSSGGGINPNTPTTKNYFAIEGANYNASALPTPTGGDAPYVEMNNTVIPGGSNYVTVTSLVEAAKIFIGVDGMRGYYELVPNNRGVNEIVYDFVMVMNQELTGDSFVVSIGILDENGEVSEYWNTETIIHVVGTGTLQVSLSFDNNKDVDLHLFEPNGYHIYYDDRISPNGGILDLDSNPNCAIDGINNENITYGEDAYVEPGEYTVYVDMWENCDPSIATNFVLTVFYGGALIGTVEGVNPIAGTFPIGEPSNYAELDNIQPVCHFVIPDNGQQPPAKSSQKKLPKFLRSQDK